MGVQEVRCDKGDKVRAGDYKFFQLKKKRKSTGNRIFFLHHRIISEDKRVEFVRDRMS